MTILYSNNFDSDTAAALPAGWASKVGTWAVGTRNPVSGAQTFGSTSDADGDVALYTGATAVADMQVETSQKLVSGGGVQLPVISHILRSDSANTSHYAVIISSATTTSFDILFFKRVGGAYAQIAQDLGNALVRAVGDVFRMRTKIVGSTITVEVALNGAAYAQVASITDATVTAAGYPGLYYSKVVAPMAIDDFVLDDTTAAAGATVTGVTVSPSTANVSGGATQAFSATVSGTNSPSQAVTWSTNVGSINSSGVYTAPAATGSAQTATVTATSSQDGTKSGTATVTIPATTANNALANATGNVLFSPYNWNLQASSAKTINAGAYFKTIFGGTACTLNFDMTGIAAPLPQISYRVDRFGPWISVPIAASVAITIPADTADYANKPGHLLEVLVKSMTETQARWNTQATAVKLTGIILDAGKTLAAPPALPLNAIFYGDSITEGVRTVNMTATDDTNRNDAGQGWSLEAARILGAEIGNIGFGASGFNSTGSGGVPALPNSYNLLYAGVSRSFAVSPDVVVLMHGTNDSGDVTANATTVLNGLLAATTAKIVVLRPFNGTAHASQLQAAVAACSTPSRCTYVDTAGWFTTANSSDNLHPYGVENITHIAPLVANAVRSIMSGTFGLALRTVSVTLGLDSSTAAANLAGAKVAFYDEPTPDLYKVARFQTNAETCDANGVLTFTCNSSLPAGGTGGFVVQFADGKHYNGQVVVS
jgi:lysophospholipase L1-like esterase